jgi:hypothetical protein
LHYWGIVIAAKHLANGIAIVLLEEITQICGNVRIVIFITSILFLRLPPIKEEPRRFNELKGTLRVAIPTVSSSIPTDGRLEVVVLSDPFTCIVHQSQVDGCRYYLLRSTNLFKSLL